MDTVLDPNTVFAGLSRESTIRRDAAGRWSHDGEPIEHRMLARAFDRWISRAQDDRYCLSNGIDWVYITLEGAPLFVRSLRIQRGREVILLLSNDKQRPLEPDTLRQAEDGALYCEVRKERMVARFDRHAMSQLEELLDEDEQGVFVRLGDRRVRPPVVTDPLQPF